MNFSVSSTTLSLLLSLPLSLSRQRNVHWQPHSRKFPKSNSKNLNKSIHLKAILFIQVSWKHPCQHRPSRSKKLQSIQLIQMHSWILLLLQLPGLSAQSSHGNSDKRHWVKSTQSLPGSTPTCRPVSEAGRIGPCGRKKRSMRQVLLGHTLRVLLGSLNGCAWVLRVRMCWMWGLMASGR